MRVWISIILTLVLAGYLFGQQRLLISPENDGIPIGNGQSASQVVQQTIRQSHRVTDLTCDGKVSIGYNESEYPSNTVLTFYHKDVAGMWFVVPYSGQIDTLFWWGGGSSVGALDSLVNIRVHESAIGPNSGPGVDFPPACTDWGYFPNTSDADQGIGAFAEVATGAWIPNILGSYPPTGDLLWGPYPAKHRVGEVSYVRILDGGTPLNVTQGDSIFISMTVNSPNAHVSDDYTGWYTRSTVPFNHRTWKFYEHLTTSCGGSPTQGWKAREYGVYNWWFVMTTSDNVPPQIANVTNPNPVYTFNTTDQSITADILDCDYENPGEAGVSSALIKWTLNGLTQTDISMTPGTGTTFAGNIPGQPKGSEISYYIWAEDGKGLSSESRVDSYYVGSTSNEWYDLSETSGAVYDISETGTDILPAEFFNPQQPLYPPADDGTAGPFDIGGPFIFNGNAVRYAWVGVNGAIALTASGLDTQDVNSGGFASWSWSIPNGLQHNGRGDLSGSYGVPKNFVSVFWNDLVLDDGVTTFGNILQQQGYGGDTCLFIVQWESLGVWTAGSVADPATFRVILNRCAGTIEFQYDNVGEHGLDTTALVGIEKDSSGIYPGDWICWNNRGYPLATIPTNGLHLKFVYNRALNSIAGMKFNDANGNGQKDVSEVGLENWEIQLVRIDSTGPLSTLTDASGYYTFTDLSDGRYLIKEVNQPHWVQTCPPPPAMYDIEIVGGSVYTGNDFGNTYGHSYQGASGGTWSTPGNWEGSAVPQPGDAVIIPTNVFVDSLPNDSILALRVAQTANLTFGSTAGALKIRRGVTIDEGGTITAGTAGLVCYGNWQNQGDFIPGTSTVTFAGNDEKIIDPTTFYNLNIAGLNTRLGDNLGVNNTLSLDYALSPRPEDTVLIHNPSANAIVGDGIITQGTISREIQQGETDPYRFESPSSYVQFDGTGTYPTSVTVTCQPDTVVRSFSQLGWLVVQGVGTRDTLDNTIGIEVAPILTKWCFGVPRPRATLMSTVASAAQSLGSQSDSVGIPIVRRMYAISAEGGNGSSTMAKLQLRYDQFEVPPDSDESKLVLLSGPVVSDSLEKGWNMISLPVIPSDGRTSMVFPEASSGAFRYEGSYAPDDSLDFGRGYWLKFPSAPLCDVLGDDRETGAIPLDSGWNLIGALSYPMSLSSVASSPPGIISSGFFGYQRHYYLTDSLLPLHAYWVKANSSGSLLLDATGSSTGSSVILPKLSALAGLNTLTVTDAVGNEQTLYFGADTALKTNTARYELPPLPPAGSFDVRYSTQRLVETNQSNHDLTVPITITSAVYPVKVSWDKPSDASLVVGERTVRLTRAGALRISESTIPVSLLLAANTGEQQVPVEFALHQNYPNPFNPSTEIRYALPKTSHVSLKVFNLLGQAVADLVESEQPAGWYTALFNASKLSSGIYFYTLRAGDYTDTKKMMLVK